MTAIEVDARGLRCPLPVIRLAEAALNAPDGTVITVLATDPAARHDVPAWCRMRDQELREMSEVSVADPATAEGGAGVHLRFVVVVRGQPSRAAGAGSRSARSSRST